MSKPSDLMLRLAMGAAGLPEELRRRHAAFVAHAQHADGGFPGRRGPSDLYYTAFALRSLAILGELTPEIAARAARYLAAQPFLPDVGNAGQFGPPTVRLESHACSPADFVSLVTSALVIELATGRDLFAEVGLDRCKAVTDFFRPFHREDGGYAKTERGASSTYQTFLVVLTKQLIGAPLDGAGHAVEMVRSRQREDGGFVELGVLQGSGTNPTAAAIALLRALDALEEPTVASATQFLAAMQTPEGGLRAHARIPMPDLLSTFTGLVTLADLDALSAVDTSAVQRFARSLEESSGGFRAGEWDATPDVEYTFYGLGTLALLEGADVPGK